MYSDNMLWTSVMHASICLTSEHRCLHVLHPPAIMSHVQQSFVLLLPAFDIKERFDDLNRQTDSPFFRLIYVPDKYRPAEAQTE